ncbi:uncharacterized protein LOC144344832, partial [Saccoglossus kowalevskii]
MIIKQCLTDLEKKIDNLSTTVNGILGEQKRLGNKVSDMRQKCVDYEKYLQFTSNELDDVKKRNTALEIAVKDLTTRLQVAEKSELTLRQKRYARGYDLRFGSITERENENCTNIVKDILTQKFKMKEGIDDAYLLTEINRAKYYSRYVPNFATIVAILIDLTRKDQPRQVIWGDSQEKAFTEMKCILSKQPRLPDFSKPFILRSDASYVGIGAVLLQELDGYYFPLAYA